MADRKKAGITGAGGTNVDPLYNHSFPPNASTYPSMNFNNLMNGPKRGAGDPDYIKKMIASGKAKKTTR
jgi:hypothetical protein